MVLATTDKPSQWGRASACIALSARGLCVPLQPEPVGVLKDGTETRERETSDVGRECCTSPVFIFSRIPHALNYACGNERFVRREVAGTASGRRSKRALALLLVQPHSTALAVAR